MKKYNIFVMSVLLFWIQAGFAEDTVPYEVKTSNEIPDTYELLLFDETKEPEEAWTDFGLGLCTLVNECSLKNETQGLTSIGDNYWILSKNKWLYVYKLENGSPFFSRSNEKDQISNDDFDYDNSVKFNDIDFVDGYLYVPNGKRIDIFEWNQATEKFERNFASLATGVNSFGAAVHPYSKHIFYKMNPERTQIEGIRLVNNEMQGCGYHIWLRNRTGELTGHYELTDDFWTQGMAFSPSGRFLFFVHDDAYDADSDYTGIYVYYFDEENYEKLFSSGCNNRNVDVFLVGFKNIKYDPDIDGESPVRLDELEGIHVREIQGYDVHQLMLHNTSTNSDEKFSIYHYKTGDYDGDGIKDIYDNCPFDSNPEQKDRNGDGIGDVCQDYDKDGILDFEDNCPEDFNPNQEDLDGDGEGDACDDIDDDDWSDEKDPCPYDKNTSMNKCGGENCRQTSSECCLNERKKCDMDGDGRWDEEPEFENFYDNYGFAAGAWGKRGISECNPTDWHSNSLITTWYEDCIVGKYLKIEGGGSYLKDSDNKYTNAKISSYYCYCGKKEFEHDGCNDSGKCGTDHAHPRVIWDEQEKQPTWMPLYGSGDYTETNFEEILSDNCKAYDKKCFTPFEREWEYREDDWLMGQIGEEVNDEDPDTDNDNFVFRGTENDEDEYSDDESEEDVPRIKLAHAAVFTHVGDYVDDSDHIVNQTFFGNSEEHQTHIRGENWNTNLILAKQSTETVNLVVERKMFFAGYITPGYGKWYWEMLREYIGEKPWWNENLPFARQFEDIVKENPYESISRPSLFSRVSYNGDEIKIQAVRYHDNYNQMFAYAAQNGIYYQENDTFKLAFSDAVGMFENAITVQNGFEMRSAALAVKGLDIYMAAGMTLTQSQITRNPFEGHPAEEKPIRNQRFARIYFVNGNAVMEELASLPWTPEYITLFVTDGQIHAMMMNETGVTSVLAYSYENNSWTNINTFNFGQVFSLNNTFVRDNKLYFTAPNAEGKTALYTWDSSNSFVEIAHLNSDYDSFIKPFEYMGQIILADLKEISGNSVVSWELGEGNVFAEGTIPIDKPVIRRYHVYCMKESETALQGGLTISGECVPFTHPWYKSLSAGTTVYSIAGKGNRLYVGTNDSIRIYDISDANTFTLVSTFQTNNARVYDMEIEGDTLFAATSKGLYKLDASDPDELSQTFFVSTGSTNQYEIELYVGKVYVGDDYGIKIRDKETLSVLLSANSGAVYDFAIENGEIAMFRSSFWNSGIQFRDAETLVETAYDYTSCYDAEIETYNGKFYLACDNYTYSFEADNGYIYFTQLTGDKRELQEVYTYNGYTYIPDGNTIKLSTHEDVPALCGNGIVEGDEVCDGGQIDCDELDSSYVSGIAACNSTCDGYVLDNCTAGNGGDGW